MRRLIAGLGVLALVAGLVAGIATPARADAVTDLEACFLSKINAARAANGAQALTKDTTLTGYGRRHSADMAAAGQLYHSSGSDLAPYLPSGWRKWGENVGVGGSGDCTPLFDAFMRSDGHRRNLLDPDFSIAGIGVYIDDAGTIWTTHVFVQVSNATTTTTTAPPTTTTTTAPTTTTTTTPPTTTTTASTTTTAPPTTTTTASTTTTAPTTTTTTASTTTTTAAPPTTTTTTTTTAPPTTTTTAPPTTTTTTQPTVGTGSTTTTTLAAAGPGGGGPGDLVAAWVQTAELCNDPDCGGDQMLLAIIGGLLLGGSAITTRALKI